MKMPPYYPVDVFGTSPLSGNWLTVFTGCEELSDAGMLLILWDIFVSGKVFKMSNGFFDPSLWGDLYNPNP
jgi:predicted PhzF superfamily epimerase YddE/YHI9